MELRVTVTEIYELSTHPDTGEPITTFEEASEVFKVDPGWFDWSEREIIDVAPWEA